MAAQRVHALFLAFKDSPCKTVIDDGVQLAQNNGWATQVYHINGIVTEVDHCKWLLSRVVQDTVTMAQREQAQLFIFYGGYGTANEKLQEEAVLHGSMTGNGTEYCSSISLFSLLTELSKSDGNCLLVLHTSMAGGCIATWRKQNEGKSINLQVLLFNETQSVEAFYPKDEQGKNVKGPQGFDWIDNLHNVPFKQLDEAKRALSHMIKTCYLGKLQLNQSFLQKLDDIGLRYTTYFHQDTAALFALESPGGDKAIASASHGQYRNVSVFLLAFDIPGWPKYRPQLRLEMMSSVLRKCYDFEVELFHPPPGTEFLATEWVVEALKSHIQKHNRDDSLLILCYSGEAWTSPTDNDIHVSPDAGRLRSFNMTKVDSYLHDNVRSDVLRIMDCEHAATLSSETLTTRNAKTDKSKSNMKNRIFELMTSKDRTTLFERVIGRLINRAGSAFTINDLMHDLQDVDPDSARTSRRRRSTAGPSQGKAIPPKEPGTQ